MRIRFSIELHIERQPDVEPEQHEHRDNDGTLSENIGQPRYVGFIPQEEWKPDV